MQTKKPGGRLILTLIARRESRVSSPVQNTGSRSSLRRALRAAASHRAAEMYRLWVSWLAIIFTLLVISLAGSGRVREGRWGWGGVNGPAPFLFSVQFSGMKGGNSRSTRRIESEIDSNNDCNVHYSVSWLSDGVSVLASSVRAAAGGLRASSVCVEAVGPIGPTCGAMSTGGLGRSVWRWMCSGTLPLG